MGSVISTCIGIVTTVVGCATGMPFLMSVGISTTIGGLQNISNGRDVLGISYEPYVVSSKEAEQIIRDDPIPIFDVRNSQHSDLLKGKPLELNQNSNLKIRDIDTNKEYFVNGTGFDSPIYEEEKLFSEPIVTTYDSYMNRSNCFGINRSNYFGIGRSNYFGINGSNYFGGFESGEYDSGYNHPEYGNYGDRFQFGEFYQTLQHMPLFNPTKKIVETPTEPPKLCHHGEVILAVAQTIRDTSADGDPIGCFSTAFQLNRFCAHQKKCADCAKVPQSALIDKF